MVDPAVEVPKPWLRPLMAMYSVLLWVSGDRTGWWSADRISPWYRSAAWMVGMFKSSRILFKPRVARREDNQFAS